MCPEVHPLPDDPSTLARERIAEHLSGSGRSEGQPGGKAGEIVAALTTRLGSGAIEFGETLSINLLAQEFNASRQPVSVAINHLRSLGYVIVVPQVGCRVVSPSAAEIGDFFHVLAHMESALANLAAKRHEDTEVEVLAALADEIASTPFDTEARRRHYAAAVDAFHSTIWDMSRATAIIDRIRDLWQLADFYLWHGAGNLDSAKVDIANRERDAIVRAIKRHDADKAESLMAKHVHGKPARVGII